MADDSVECEATSDGGRPSAAGANRRGFGARLLAWGATAAALAAQGSTAAPPASDGKAGQPAAPADDAPQAPPAPRPMLLEEASEEQLVLEWIRRSDPERLKPEHLAALARETAANFARGAMLQSYPLENGDFPMTLPRFRPPPAPGG